MDAAFDFDTDSCYNSAAVDADGNVNPGRHQCSIGEDIEKPDRICRQKAYLDNSNVYYRVRVSDGWTAIMYGYYMEVDDTGGSECNGGHRHDWEHVVVWIYDDEVKAVAASAHGKYQQRWVSLIPQWGWDGEHVKIVYHKDGDSTHSMRFSEQKDNNPVENHNGQWYYGPLISYHGLVAENEVAFNAMMDYDWGAATIDFKDDHFKGALDKAKSQLFGLKMDTGNDGVPQGTPGCSW